MGARMNSKRLKFIISIFIIIPILISIYLIFFAKNTCVDWIDFIRFQNINYENTNIMLEPDMVGKELGQVIERAPTKINRVSFQTKNGHAGWLDVGTKFYEVKGYDNKGYICVYVHNAYYLYKSRNFEVPKDLMKG